MFDLFGDTTPAKPAAAAAPAAGGGGFMDMFADVGGAGASSGEITYNVSSATQALSDTVVREGEGVTFDGLFCDPTFSHLQSLTHS